MAGPRGIRLEFYYIKLLVNNAICSRAPDFSTLCNALAPGLRQGILEYLFNL
jgi:hypothetical protein